MDEPTADDLLDAFVSPYVSRLSPPFAAAHLLAAGADGPALRELAGLSEREFEQALELIPAASLEAEQLLAPARLRLEEQSSLPPPPMPAVVVAWSSDRIGDGIDELAAFVDALAARVERAGLGEVDGLVDEADEQVLLCYGSDLPALEALVQAHVRQAPVPPQRIEVRPPRP